MKHPFLSSEFNDERAFQSNNVEFTKLLLWKLNTPDIIFSEMEILYAR
jgi:hypothetical protein